MKTAMRIIFVSALLLSAAVFAAPLTVLYPSAGLDSGEPLKDLYATRVSLMLADGLSGLDDVRTVSESWSESLYRSLFSGSYGKVTDPLATFRTRVKSLDCIFVYEPDFSKAPQIYLLNVRICGRKGVRSKALRLGISADLQSLADWLPQGLAEATGRDKTDFESLPGRYRLQKGIHETFFRLKGDKLVQATADIRAAMTPVAEAPKADGTFPYEDVCAARAAAAGGNVAALQKASSNASPLVRCVALRLLGEKKSAGARLPALAGLKDPHGLVRFYAARTLARTATAADADALAASLKREEDAATRLYLEDALAKAKGLPKPPPRPAANPSLREEGPAMMWMCFQAGDIDTFPCEAVYTCDLPRVPDAAAKRAHGLGKPIFSRPTPVANPGLLFCEPSEFDAFWNVLKKQVTPEILPYTDGFVYGEESMSVNPGHASDSPIWKSAWRLFCRAAKIDPVRVGGDYAKLTPDERCAWMDWGTRFCVDGFNFLYDFTKDYWGKLRPGLQVATHMCNETEGTCADRDWKFDLSGGYYYTGDGRYVYTKCRSMKTMWPDRPLMWLSLAETDVGLGNYLNPVPLTAKVADGWPTRPISYRFDHPYLDNIAAWLAGADPGYYAHYLPYGTKKEVGPGFVPTMIGESNRTFATSMDNLSGRDPALRTKFVRGFGYMRRYLTEVGNVFASLPRNRPPMRPRAVMIGDRLSGNRTGGFLCREYDADALFQDTVNRGALDNYDVAVYYGGWMTPRPQRMTEAGRRAWIRWLRDRGGALLLATWPDPDVRDPNNRVSKAELIGGDLKTPWPWKGALERIPKTAQRAERYKLVGPDVFALKEDKDGAVIAVWAPKDYRAVVIFDAEETNVEHVRIYEAFLRKRFAEKKIDFPFAEAPGRMVEKLPNGLTVAMQSLVVMPTTNRLQGCELLTGQWNPVMRPDLPAAIVAEEHVGPYAAVHDGVCVFAEEHPFESVEKVPSGLKVRSRGLVRVTCRGGQEPKITGGVALRMTSDDANVWFLEGSEGRVVVPAHGTPGRLSKVRPGGHVDEIPDWHCYRTAESADFTILRK